MGAMKRAKKGIPCNSAKAAKKGTISMSSLWPAPECTFVLFHSFFFFYSETVLMGKANSKRRLANRNGAVKDATLPCRWWFL